MNALAFRRPVPPIRGLRRVQVRRGAGFVSYCPATPGAKRIRRRPRRRCAASRSSSPPVGAASAAAPRPRNLFCQGVLTRAISGAREPVGRFVVHGVVPLLLTGSKSASRSRGRGKEGGIGVPQRPASCAICSRLSRVSTRPQASTKSVSPRRGTFHQEALRSGVPGVCRHWTANPHPDDLPPTRCDAVQASSPQVDPEGTREPPHVGQFLRRTTGLDLRKQRLEALMSGCPWVSRTWPIRRPAACARRRMAGASTLGPDRRRA